MNIFLYDDLDIRQDNNNKLFIKRKGNSLSYSLYGILDIDKNRLKSIIDFEIDPEQLFDYGYLDGKRVKINVIRIDFEF